jgi:outer membrane protein insertion porin family
VGRFAVQEIKASPRLEDGVDDWFQSTFDPSTGTYTDVEVLQSVFPLGESGLPPSYLSIPNEPGFLDLNGDNFLNYTVTASWSQSTLNRGRMATRGAAQSVAFEVSAPSVSDLEFYKVTYRGEIFYPVPLLNSWTLRLRTELGYGDGYGDTSELPFYEHFFAGGFGSVRGYESNTLGPRSTPAEIYNVEQPVTAIDENGIPTEIGGPDGEDFGYIAVVDPTTGESRLVFNQVNDDPDPFGGNILIEGGAELLFPLPFIKDRSKLRSAFFLDAGNVYSDNCRSSQLNCFNVDDAIDELRYSVGVGLTWITGFGPMTFSLAKPLNSGEFDEEEVFQFTLGRGF